jgi:hypothetical protein
MGTGLLVTYNKLKESDDHMDPAQLRRKLRFRRLSGVK